MPLDKWVTHIDLDAQTFSGHLPPDAIREILDSQRSSKVPPMATSTSTGHPADMSTPGHHQHKLPAWHDLVAGTTVADQEELRQMGENLLSGIKANFESFDEAERASDPRRIELTRWWMETAGAEVDKTVDKAIEYGSTDLIDIGLMLARTMRRDVDEQEAAELGVFFYLIGKIARWQSAIERGDRPSDDTLLDIGVYVRMAQRIRSAGGWPGVED
jgi:hypothetical protein